MSGMRRNPRRKGSERAGSRPLETNVLSSISEYMECSFSFPVVFVLVFWVIQLRTDKEPTG